MVATDVVMPAGIFNFTGQAKVDTFVIDLDALLVGKRAYDVAMANKYRLSLEAIRPHANEFSFRQRQKSTGRPPVLERDLLVAFLVRQLFDATFRETEGLLTMMAEYFDLDDVPDHSVMCKENARHFARPETMYQKMVSFWQHWPNRAAALDGKRDHAETTFSIIGGRSGHRLRCRSSAGRKNEVRSKIAAHNIRMLAWMTFKSAN